MLKRRSLQVLMAVFKPSSDNIGAFTYEEGKLESEPAWLPPGFRFHPTDEELVSYYLARKLLNANFKVHAISEVDLNKCEPWDLPGMTSSPPAFDPFSDHRQQHFRDDQFHFSCILIAP